MPQVPSPHHPGTRSIELQVDLNVPVETVWKALTDAEELTHWFPPTAKVTPGVGGTIEHFWKATIAIWEPNQQLRAMTSDPNAPDSEPSGADWFFDDLGGGTTRLRLVEFGYSTAKEEDDTITGITRHWESLLWGLKVYLENHCGKPRSGDAFLRHRFSAPNEEVWQRLCARGVLFSEGMLNAKAGDRFTCQAGADQLSCLLHGVMADKRTVRATIENLNGALLEFTVGKTTAYIHITTYDVGVERLNLIEQALIVQLEKILGPSVDTEK